MIRFNGFSFKEFIVGVVQYVIAVTIAIGFSPWLGVLIAMIRIDVR